jgi:hypothetical protein
MPLVANSQHVFGRRYRADVEAEHKGDLDAEVHQEREDEEVPPQAEPALGVHHVPQRRLAPARKLLAGCAL